MSLHKHMFLRSHCSSVEVAAALCILVIPQSYASGETSSLPALEINASRMPSSWIEAPYSISAVEAMDLEERSVRNLPEALSSMPGVMIQKTANGQGSPYLRGFTGYRTLTMIDGIRYNNSIYRDGPNEYSTLIDHQTLERVELISGPASVSYGSDAVGGTLHLSTRSTSLNEEQAAHTYIHGSQSCRWSSAEQSQISRTRMETGRGGVWGLLFGYTASDFGEIDAASLGTLPKTGYGQIGADARFDMLISENWQITLNHQQSNQDDVWRTHATVFGVPFAGTERGTDLRRLKDLSHTLDYLKLTGNDLQSILDRATLTLSMQTWNERGDRIKSDQSRQLEMLDSRMWGADFEMESVTSMGRLLYGVDIYQDHVDTARRDYHPDGSLDQIQIQGPVGDDSTYTWLGAHLQAAIPMSDLDELTLGSRFNQTKAQIGRYEDPATGLPSSYDGTWNDVVSSVRMNHRLEESSPWILWGGISQSFRAPNLADLSRYGLSRSNETEVAATDLEPEKFLTGEIGLKTEQNRYMASLTAYCTKIQDYITSTPTGKVIDGLTEVTKRNSGSGEIFGTEVSAMWRFDDQWSAQGNITWLHGNLESYPDTTSSTMKSQPMSRVQPITGTFSLRWDSSQHPWWSEFACTLVDRADRLSRADREDTQRIPPGGTPGYVLAGLYGGYQINSNVRVHAALKNILNQSYRSHGSGTNEPGFGLDLGLTAEF